MTNIYGQTPPVQPRDPAGDPRVEAQALTPDEQAAVDLLYDTLKPEATETARNYVLNRTPAVYQEAMTAKIDADWPAPPVEDPAVLESRRLDRESYKRSATAPDPNPNLDPNMPPGSIYAPQRSPLA